MTSVQTASSTSSSSSSSTSTTSSTSTNYKIKQQTSRSSVKKEPSEVVNKSLLGAGSIPISQRNDIAKNSSVSYSKSNACVSPKNSKYNDRSSSGRSSTDSSSPERYRRQNDSYTNTRSNQYDHSEVASSSTRRTTPPVNRRTPDKIPYYLDEKREKDRLRRVYGSSDMRRVTRSRSRSRTKSRASNRRRSYSRERYDRRRHSSRSSSRHRHRKSRSRTRSPKRKYMDRYRNEDYSHAPPQILAIPMEMPGMPEYYASWPRHNAWPPTRYAPYAPYSTMMQPVRVPPPYGMPPYGPPPGPPRYGMHPYYGPPFHHQHHYPHYTPRPGYNRQRYKY